MTSDKSDKSIRKKLRDVDPEVREVGLEELDSKYRVPVCGYLSWCFLCLGYFRLLSEIPDIWQETAMTVWCKAGSGGEINEEGSLWPYIQKIAHNISLTHSRSSARWHRDIDDSVDFTDLLIQDDRRYDEAHPLHELLARHYNAFPQDEIWVLEIQAGFRVGDGELFVDETRKRKISKLETITVWFNHRVDAVNRCLDASVEQGDARRPQATHIDTQKTATILDRARKRLFRILELKGEF